MKTIKFFISAAAVLLSLSLLGCFSDYNEGYGSITISFGSNSRSRYSEYFESLYNINYDDITAYKIYLLDEAGLVKNYLEVDASHKTVTITGVEPGEYIVSVRAYGYISYDVGSTTITNVLVLMGYGEAAVHSRGHFNINMKRAIAIDHGHDLFTVLQDDDKPDDLIVLIDNEESSFDLEIVADVKQNITLISDIQISVFPDDSYIFNIAIGKTLTLGSMGMRGHITVNGIITGDGTYVIIPGKAAVIPNP